jgi:hypothetical protein
MAVTAAQVRAGKATVLDRLYLRYPPMRPTILRVLLQLYRQGDATDKEVARAILEQAFQAAEGEALGHRARHQFADALSRDDDVTTGIDEADSAALLAGVL